MPSYSPAARVRTSRHGASNARAYAHGSSIQSIWNCSTIGGLYLSPDTLATSYFHRWEGYEPFSVYARDDDYEVTPGVTATPEPK
ncbi:MAG: hypothetical protein SGI73_01945 [Chloroflexota bacterium]|nr:hypothetical protein [Chloroflexota bacterium]